MVVEGEELPRDDNGGEWTVPKRTRRRGVHTTFQPGSQNTGDGTPIAVQNRFDGLPVEVYLQTFDVPLQLGDCNFILYLS